MSNVLLYLSGCLATRKSLISNLKQTLFAVPMTCDGCVKDISGALHKLQGIAKVEAGLQDQLVSIEGTGELH